jgi:hypothetical protein
MHTSNKLIVAISANIYITGLMVKYGDNTVCSVVQGLTNNLAISVSLHILSLKFIIEFDSIENSCHPIVTHALQHLATTGNSTRGNSLKTLALHFFKKIFKGKLFWECKKKSQTKAAECSTCSTNCLAENGSIISKCRLHISGQSFIFYDEHGPTSFSKY